MESLILLGSGGWIPTRERETCCAYTRDGKRALLIDAGTGVRRLVERPDLLDGLEGLDILLTHFHLDHVAGLSYLPALPLRPVVWGPGEALYGAATRSILERLVGPPFFGATIDDVVSGVRELPIGTTEVAGVEVSTRAQRLHTHPTLALRLGDWFTYCTDTAADAGNVEFAAAGRVLVHEAWYAESSTDDRTHAAAGEAARIARQAGVERLVLIHVNPLGGPDEELARVARADFPAASVGRDMEEVRVLRAARGPGRLPHPALGAGVEGPDSD